MGKHKSETAQQKSPAEFFASNQAIAGFDNPGKSLYTTIRELVENGLDAAESIGSLPEINVTVEELSREEFNKYRGVKGAEGRKDENLFKDRGGSKRDSTGSEKEDTYYIVTVKDNGCGMSHSSIPNMLGIVLSGSKYGVRQTRGKFGLGAKMALIWGKKSTGIPVTVVTSHTKNPGEVPAKVSKCILDIDIYKNLPRVEEHTERTNHSSFVGTEFKLCIGGSWKSHGKFIKSYLQKLAVITPYASFSFDFVPGTGSKTTKVSLSYPRTSDNMPPLSKHVKHHPSSVNNLLIQQLLDISPKKTLLSFLTGELSGITKPVALRIISELSCGDSSFSPSMPPSSVTQTQINRICQILKTVTEFRAPDATCLSPAGEYNLRLGIQQHYNPDHLFTHTSKPGAVDGHPFLVEVGVAFGGSCREKINVTRFANRIPLLFESGSDVCTKVCAKGIDWKAYYIDPVGSRVEVFVSIVSTKVPFKGTGKEYIADNVREIKDKVTRGIQACARQIKEILGVRKKLGDAKARRSKLTRYIPDASKALFGILQEVVKRNAEKPQEYAALISSVKSKKVTVDSFSDKLKLMVNEEVTKAEESDLIKSKGQGNHPDEQNFYIGPVKEEEFEWGKTVDTGKVFFVPRGKRHKFEGWGDA
ncbi:hypothetical protein TrVE_jg2972 [Triparma verrucosa]|uniref:DNA topoisomerase VI subunit B transducer domain-containing protein n=1 Tax=Triparma verrucosa TaxID=1606542 RepID=A0A9W7FFA7_9STRA|nr:hypothetical protein TrVE_jg2972 [Triparma verrucosa]